MLRPDNSNDQEAASKSDPSFDKATCPQCSGPAIPITYGLPTETDFDDPTFYSGGCIVFEGQSNWACRKCGIEFE